MVLKIDKILLISLVVALLLIQTSASSPVQNESLEALTARFDNLQVKVEHLETKNAANEAKILQQEEEITKLKAKVDAKCRSDVFNDAERDPHSTNNDKMSFKTDRIESLPDNSLPRDVMPSSCRDLALIGHTLNGLYLVQNLVTNKIETVYCNLKNPDITQNLIGTVDVKTKSVHFYVQRNTSFSQESYVIPWELARINEGNAMDLESGVFTAPVPGIYHFEFSGIKNRDSNQLWVWLYLNGAYNIGRAYTYQLDNPGSYETISFTATLRLKANDTIYLVLSIGELMDYFDHYTHFTGWLMEEDLMV